MSAPAARATSLPILVGLAVANHVVLAGSRVAVSLDALALGASPATVGLLLALFAVLPMMLAIPFGRMVDRIGVRRPMLLASCGIAVAVLLPVAAPGLPALFATACLMGVSFMVFQVSTQYVTGEVGTPGERARNFSLLALGLSTSSIVGPLLTGLVIDGVGFRAAFAVLALAPLVPLFVLGTDRLALPSPHPEHARHATRSALDLLTHHELKRVFLINAITSAAWELHTLFVPLYGQSIGLTASAIGFVLAAFAAATFIVRLAMPLLARRFSEHRILTLALFVGGSVYLLFPFARSTGTLMSLSFCLGLGMGASQPMVMALLHHHAPAGRMGEATGVRSSLVNSMAVAVPLVFGAVGSTVGLAPVLWSVGVFLAGSGFLMRRA
jgi:MFS family permease